MAEFSIKRAHHSTLADAKKMAEKVADSLGKQYQLKSNWKGDVLCFTCTGVNGELAVTAQHLEIDVKLGFLMAAFKRPIHEAVEKNLDSLIKPASKAPTKAAEAAKPSSKTPVSKAKK